MLETRDDEKSASKPREESGVPTRVCATASKAVAVIEDDVVLRTAICDALRDAGLEPHPASTLPNARKILGLIHPCAIVLDLRLEGGEGLPLVKEMAGEGVEVPIVIISADLGLLREHPPDPRMLVLRKPFELDHLVDAVLAAIVT